MRKVGHSKIAEYGGPAENRKGGNRVPVVCRGLYGQVFHPWEFHLSCSTVKCFLCVALEGEVLDEGEAERERGAAVGRDPVAFHGEIGITQVWCTDVGEEMSQYPHLRIIPDELAKEGENEGRRVVAPTNWIDSGLDEWCEVGEN